MKAIIDFDQTPDDGPMAAGLALSPLFAGLPAEWLARVAAKALVREVEEGEVLCHQDDTAHTTWLVVDGWLKLTRETLDGSEAVWDVLGRGHLAGLETLLPPYQYRTRAVAVDRATLLAIPHSVLRELLEASHTFAILLLDQTLRHQQDERLEMEHRTQQSAPQRIGCFLLRLAGTPKGGTVTLQLPFDKGLLAARLGMQPETFSRALAKLKQDVGLELEGGRLRMDVPRMEAYTCSACSGTYPCH